MKTLISGATIIDATGAAPRPGMCIGLEDGLIAGVGNRDDFGSQWTEQIDAEGTWILPGLINMHDHLAMRDLIGNPETEMRLGEIKMILNAVRNSLTALRRGWTTVRDMGAPLAVGLRVRDLINGGYMPGPRVLSCGNPLCVTGGHAWIMGNQADGADGMRRAARQQFKMGADFIKVMASEDPYLKPGPEQTIPEMTLAEMSAAVEEPHIRGRHSACHIMGETAFRNALDAGIQVMSHGAYLTDRLAERMAAQGGFLDPTLSSYLVQTMNPARQRGEAWAAAHAHLTKPLLNGFKAALKAGVRIVVGTDTSGLYAQDLALMRENGMTAMDTLIAATKNAADAIGWGDRIGTVEAGKIADLVILNADPLLAPENIESVRSVVQGGRVLNPDDIGLDDKAFLEEMSVS
jgi:imidazolonepropionase-like amidohydrolase